MSLRLLRASMVFLLLGANSAIIGQTGSAIDSAVYLAFFREAAGRVVLPPPDAPPKGEASTLNGEPTSLTSQSIQDAMGITDREAKAVVDAAAGCGDEINALEASARALVFESRLRAANDEKPPDALAERLREFEARRAGIIMSHVERLKASLDAARFEVVEDYIRARQSDGVFFPTANPKKKL
jgi:hypothetical protein